MGDVVELRVHGVGGTPPEDLLGVHAADELVRVGGESEAGFYARRADRRVEGYSWGALTSRPLLQPLWILLLPFTLMNVAGWMLPNRDQSRWGGWRVARMLVVLLGLSLTASYVFGISSIVIKQLFFQWKFNDWIANPHWRLLAGGGVVTVIGVLTSFIAGRTQKRFEQVEAKFAPATQRIPESLSGSLFSSGGDLSEPGFWENPRAARQLLWLHSVTGAGALIVYLAWAWGHLDATAMELGLRPLIWGLGLIQIGLGVLLFIVCVVTFRTPRANFVTTYFRIFGPIVATSTAFGLAGGFVAGSATVVAKLLTTRGTDVVVAGGPELKMNIAFGFGILTFVLCCIVLGAFIGFWRSRELKGIEGSQDPPINRKSPASPPDGIPRPMVGRLATARAVAGALRHIDLLLTVPAIPFAAVVFIVLIDLAHADGFLTTGLFAMVPELETVESRAPFGLRLGTLSDIGGWMATGIVTIVVARLVTNYTKPSERRLIGILWDVLTFWPRRFHPLGVRPYAERAVPELQDRIRFHLRHDERRLLLSAHSQGTILAFAALAQIANSSDASCLRRVSFLSYGSPLARLHSKFFPGYFNPTAFGEVDKSLFEGKVTNYTKAVPASWFNFYRATDYIGQSVGAPLDADRQKRLTDPSPEPDVPESLDAPFGGGPDEPLPAWIDLAKHSHYNRDPEVKRWVGQVKALLALEPLPADQGGDR